MDSVGLQKYQDIAMHYAMEFGVKILAAFAFRVIGIFGYFGIQTTTFAALPAGAGVAIGMAWSGFLALSPPAPS